ncbi:MAG: glycosyltransferase [Elusimicrobia bacterium]|nr:glycosyltransferase [Elusimicrobiota bacterium]
MSRGNALDLVSVIIPVYNAEAYIERAVRSALRQSYRSMEVIVVNDGSTDGTMDRLRVFDGRIVLLHQENKGVYAARNTGVHAARGPVIAFLDADDEWETEKVERQMRLLKRYPNVAVIATRTEEMDDRGAPFPGRAKEARNGHCDRPLNFYQELLMKGNPLSLSSVLMRKEAFERAGGFYAAERILSADYDLWIRLAQSHLFLLMSNRLTRYRVLKTSLLHGSLEKEYGAQKGIIERNRERYTARLYRKRMSRLYFDWAESAFDQNDPSRWERWRASIAHDPWNADAWRLAAKEAVRTAAKGAGSAARSAVKKALFALFSGRGLISRGPEGKTVFLTFDDGPHPQNTEEILRVLREHGAKATFFMTGREVSRHPGVAKKVAAEGHEVAGHSWSHGRIAQWDVMGQWREIVRTEDVLREACGAAVRVHRPPYGRLTVPLLLFALFRKLRIVLWSVDSGDGFAASPETVLEACRKASGGDILLFHDDNRAVVEALPRALREMRGKGLEFAAIREIK